LVDVVGRLTKNAVLWEHAGLDSSAGH